jgi:hypothetical protein
MSDYSITNHIDYKKHMKNYVTLQKCHEMHKSSSEKYVDLRDRCNARLSKARDILREQQDAISTLEKQNAELRSHLNTLAPMPTAPKCPLVPLSRHPEYIELRKKQAEAKAALREEQRKAEQTQLDADKCPDVIMAKRKLQELRKQCKIAKCNPGDIADHPDYKALIEQHLADIAEAQSKIEAEMKRKMRTDIRTHPDYNYFKAYYESEIAKLALKVPKPSKCPTCPKCTIQKEPASKPDPVPEPSVDRAPVYGGPPRPFGTSHIPTMNTNIPAGNRIHYYDTMKF